MKVGRHLFVLVLVSLFALPIISSAQMSGGIFTTDGTCSGVNINLFDSKSAVYLDGGPVRPGSAGLPDGSYYVQVTTPDGLLLGTSIGTANETPAVVVNGEFVTCYQLESILIKASDGTPGYDDTTNNGGTYKVWVSTVPTFDNAATKTDNFKVIPNLLTGTLTITKFYDANANGVKDADEVELSDWLVLVEGPLTSIESTPVALTVEAMQEYTVTELTPAEPNWLHTTPLTVNVTVLANESASVEFGNVCLGPGGGLTLGFWSNKNGQRLIGADDLALLRALNLVNGQGQPVDPTTAAQVNKFLLGANAVNMANMLSAQLAAMALNVHNGKVDGDALIYAPGLMSANSLGFATVSDVIAEANASLGTDPLTLAGHPQRAYQTQLKDALDNANNNRTFVQPAPCEYNFVP